MTKKDLIRGLNSPVHDSTVDGFLPLCVFTASWGLAQNPYGSYCHWLFCVYVTVLDRHLTN